jgi:hypothetical protein
MNMKLTKSTWWAFALMIVAAAISRVMVYNVAGIAPQMAIALFGGAVIKDKKWAFALPLFSLFLSDLILQGLYIFGISERAGFYGWQWAVYVSFAVVTIYGFLMKKINFRNVAFFSMGGGMLFFIISNFFVWLSPHGFNRPLTFDGLMLCYGDALAYYRDYGMFKGIPIAEPVTDLIFNGFFVNQLPGHLAWCAILFGGYYLITRSVSRHQPA